MPQLNLSKWKDFVQGILYADPGVGQNLNDDLQGRIGDELDAILADLDGDAIIRGLVVSAGAGLSVSISAGAAVVQGQRVVLAGTGSVSALTPSATLKIYVQAGAPYSTASRGWPTSFGATVGAPGASQLLLATVTTSGSGVTSVMDERVLVEPGTAVLAALDDTVTPISIAPSLRQRLNMLGARIKAMLGTATWLDAVPISLAAVLAKFHETTGHGHTGVAGDGPVLPLLHETTGHTHTGAIGQGPKIAATEIVVAPTGAIASVSAQAALAELDSEKLARAGGTMTGALVLAGAPTIDLHAATKAYVDGAGLRASGRLTKIGANLVYGPFLGTTVPIGGISRPIPPAGVTLAPTGLVANTTYFIYATWTAGALALVPATTGHLPDAFGYEVNSAAPGNGTLVGMARTDAAGLWVDTATQRFVISEFNPQLVRAVGFFSANRLRALVATSWAEVHAEIRVEFLIRVGREARAIVNGSVLANTAAAPVGTSIGFDGALAEDVYTSAFINNTTIGFQPVGLNYLKLGLAEGNHFATLLGKAASGAMNGTWLGAPNPFTQTTIRTTLAVEING